jgi:type VI secretion system protein ImpF
MSARALLFERLVDDDPHTPTEPRPLRTLSQQELRASVRREVRRLLNTRCLTGVARTADREPTVLQYGVPDLADFSPQSPTDSKRLAALLSQAIAAFEPRLRQVRVTVERFVDDHKALLARLDAILVVEAIKEPVSFPILIQRPHGETEVHENDRAG